MPDLVMDCFESKREPGFDDESFTLLSSIKEYSPLLDLHWKHQIQSPTSTIATAIAITIGIDQDDFSSGLGDKLRATGVAGDVETGLLEVVFSSSPSRGAAVEIMGSFGL